MAWQYFMATGIVTGGQYASDQVLWNKYIDDECLPYTLGHYLFGVLLFSSAVPSGPGAFQMPTRQSAAASTLRGGRANLRNASVTFSLFWHEASLGYDINNIS